MTTTAPPVTGVNPFVGPRSFTRDEKLHGRDREIRELLDLLVADRIVLCYSPSGAGKTSLIQAGLAPRLEEEGFDVLPMIRLKHDPPGDGVNRYVASAAGCVAAAADAPGASLRERLSAVPVAEGRTGVLVFDQFEEVLSLDPTDTDAKREFFVQLGDLLRDRRWWVLFAMREDFLAALDPYLPLLPTRLASRFRLDLLGSAAAREVVTRTAASAGRTFDEEASAVLVTELSRMVGGRIGPYVEPVQLQVVCRRLWDRLPPGVTEITKEVMGDIGDVDGALGAYYGAEVAKASADTGVPERTIREWFERELVTEHGFRGQAQTGPGGDERVVRLLQDAHLVRPESRRGTTWYELAHDRLVPPVLADNDAWSQEHLTVFQRQAALWDQQGRSDGLLVGDEILDEGEALAADPDAPLSAAEQAFLAACRRARAAAERERKSVRRTRQLLAAACVALVVAVLSSAVAFGFYQTARRDRDRAEAGERARLAGPAIDMVDADPNLSVQLALKALEKSDDVEDAAGVDAQEALLGRIFRSGRVGMTVPTSGVQRVALSPDGTLLATSGEDGLAVWGAQGWSEPAFAYDLRASAYDEPVPLAFSPDGKDLVGADAQGSVAHWRSGQSEFDVLVTGADPPDQRGGSGSRPVAAVAFGSDGRRLVVAEGASDRVHVGVSDWPDASDGITGTIPTGTAGALALGAGGSMLAAAADDGTVKLWRIGENVVGDGRAVTGTDLRALRGHEGAVDALTFSPDGRHVATGGEDGTIRLWAVESDEPGRVLAVLEGGARTVAFSGDGRWLAAGGAGGEVGVIDTASGRMRFRADPRTGPVNDVALDASGDSLAVVTEDGAPSVWDVRRKDPPGHAETVYGVDFDRTGGRVATASADGTAAVWDLEGNELAVLSGHGAEVNAVRFLGGDLLATAGDDGTARLWSIGSARAVRTFEGHEDSVYDLAVSPDGAQLATAGQDETARVWDVASGATVGPPLDAGSPLAGVAFSPDGTLLATTAEDRTLVWDLARRRILKTLPTSDAEGPAPRVAFSPDGALLAASFSNGTVVWDVASGAERKRFPSPWTLVSGVAFSPDGRRFFTADGNVRDTASGAPVLRLSPSFGVAFDPSGTTIATAGGGNGVTISDASTGRVRGSLGVDPAFSDAVTAMALDLPRRRLATASGAGVVTLWDTAGRALRTFGGGRAPVRDLDISPNGQLLVTTGDDGWATIWDLDSGEALDSFADPTREDGPGSGDAEPEDSELSGVTRARFVDDRTIVVAPVSGGAWRVALASGPEPRRVADQRSQVLGISENARWLAAADGRTIEVVDTRSGRREHRFSSTTTAIAAGLSDDGNRIVVVDEDGGPWVGGGGSSELRPLTEDDASAGESFVEQIAVSADGDSVAVASGGDLFVWDVGSESPTITFRASEQHVGNPIALSPGGRLVTIGLDGPVFYSRSLDALKAMASARAARPLSDDECRKYLQEKPNCAPVPERTGGGRG